ncbi:MAG: Fe-S protein assembly co-chaperone HscB [Burkholderiaceae bacterium]
MTADFPDLRDNDFELFGLTPGFAIDADALQQTFLRLQARLHPDKFGQADQAAQRLALQWATRINEAYRRLREPVSRAVYLCELRGVAVGADTSIPLPGDFLMQQIEWREALAQAADAPTLDLLQTQVEQVAGDLLRRIGVAFDETHDYPTAATLTRQLMFIDKFRLALDDAFAHEEN